jgi:hypothetical protein
LRTGWDITLDNWEAEAHGREQNSNG